MSTPSQNHDTKGLPHASVRLLLQGAIFGFIFGFLLQKGGVAKYEILMGQLLLEDWTVAQVMGTAIVVGGTGIFILSRRGMLSLHLKTTRYAANIVGGLIFGAGFAISGYCPGTGAAALGQGNFDALAVIIGMIIGSWIFAELSGWLGRTIMSEGDRGKLALDQLLHVPKVAIFAALWLVLIVVYLIAA